MAHTAHPLDYSTALRVVRDAMQLVLPAPIVVAEGANTMDNARCSPISIVLTNGSVRLYIVCTALTSFGACPHKLIVENLRGN